MAEDQSARGGIHGSVGKLRLRVPPSPCQKLDVAVRHRRREVCLAAALAIAVAGAANAQGPQPTTVSTAARRTQAGAPTTASTRAPSSMRIASGPERADLVGSFGQLGAPDTLSLDISDAFSACAWVRQGEMVSHSPSIVGKEIHTAYSVGVFSSGSWDCPGPTANRYVRLTVGELPRLPRPPSIHCWTGEWHDIVVTVSSEPGGDQIGTLYFDAHRPEPPPCRGLAGNDAPLGIGNDGELKYPFAGALGDVRLYDRVLRGPEMVQRRGRQRTRVLAGFLKRYPPEHSSRRPARTGGAEEDVMTVVRLVSKVLTVALTHVRCPARAVYGLLRHGHRRPHARVLRRKPLSLREAILAANAWPRPGRHPPAGGPLHDADRRFGRGPRSYRGLRHPGRGDVNGSGAGQTIIDGNGLDRTSMSVRPLGGSSSAA